MALNKIGGMWIRRGKQGQDYYSIRIEPDKVYLAFKNGRKTRSGQPDFLVYEKVNDEQTMEE